MPRRSKFDLELDIRFFLAQFFKEESKLLKTIELRWKTHDDRQR